ncbi:MAG: (d)CMP kinase [Clostridia bacterium]|nr:(d)CMP kinase [Clostridia bacterium]
MIIAIDGTSGSGKSTLAKRLAKTLNFGFFSAGDLYRAITVKTLNLHINENEDDKLQYMIDNTTIVYTYDGAKNVMLLDGINVYDRLHTEEVSNFVSKISCKPFIREFVRKLQKDTALHNEHIVMEGRDIGSVIFPDADFKVYVDCKIEERAKRRMKDYEALGDKVTLEKVIADMKDRDYRDMHREISPLIMCENAYLIDTSLSPVDECIELLLKEMLRRELIGLDFLKEREIELS